MRYKYSQYNVECLKKDNNVVIYNTYSGALIELNDIHLSRIKEIHNDNDFLEEDYANMDTLRTQGIIVPYEMDEVERVIYYDSNCRDTFEDLLYLTIVPTYGCNMACRYCFQKEENINIMSQELCDEILKFIVTQLTVKKKRRLHVAWFGGEPLLALDCICKLSQKIIDFCERNEIEYSSDIVTNGVLLNSENVKLLKECRISHAQVTVDGVKNQRNNRLRKDGLDSYESVVNNIVEASKDLNIVLRCNITKDSVADVKDMIFDIMETRNLKNKIEFHFSPISDYTGISKDKKYSSYCNDYEFDDVLYELIEMVGRFQDINSVKNMDICPTDIPCGAVTMDKYIIDNRGDLYKCELSLQNNAGKIGNIVQINEDMAVLFNKKHSNWLNIQIDSRCKSCEFLPLCHSGCTWERLQGKKKCTANKVLLKKLIELKYINFIAEESDSTC